MEFVQLGTSKIKVSSLALGCMNFGTRVDTEMAYRLIDQYYDAGGNFLDTANNYAFWHQDGVGGESEQLLGSWLKKRGNRSDVILATKAGANPMKTGEKEGLSAKALQAALDQSLQRLQTDYIDLYYAHFDDKDVAIEETLETLNRFVKEGKVRAIGCSNYQVDRLRQAHQISQIHDWAAYCCIQQRYTYLKANRDADYGIQVVADQELLEYCHDNQTTVLAYTALLKGAYSRSEIPEKYQNKTSIERMTTLKQVAEELSVSENQVVLAWMRQKPLSALPLISASKPEQLAENLASLDVRLNHDQLKRLGAS